MKRFFHRMHRRVEHRPWLRNSMGFVLIIGGIFGPVLPVLGLWMLPLGLVLLSTDFPWAHRLNTRIRRYFRRRAKDVPPA